MAQQVKRTVIFTAAAGHIGPSIDWRPYTPMSERDIEREAQAWADILNNTILNSVYGALMQKLMEQSP